VRLPVNSHEACNYLLQDAGLRAWTNIEGHAVCANKNQWKKVFQYLISKRVDDMEHEMVDAMAEDFGGEGDYTHINIYLPVKVCYVKRIMVDRDDEYIIARLPILRQAYNNIKGEQ
jgi:hypothetical protein